MAGVRAPLCRAVCGVSCVVCRARVGGASDISCARRSTTSGVLLEIDGEENEDVGTAKQMDGQKRWVSQTGLWVFRPQE